MKVVTTWLPEDIAERIDKLAKMKGLKRSEYVRILLVEALGERK